MERCYRPFTTPRFVRTPRFARFTVTLWLALKPAALTFVLTFIERSCLVDLDHAAIRPICLWTQRGYRCRIQTWRPGSTPDFRRAGSALLAMAGDARPAFALG